MIKPISNAVFADAKVINKSIQMVGSVDSEQTTADKDIIVSPKATSVIALLLYPHIRMAIDNYFGKPTQFALYDATIKEIAQVGHDFVYKVTISVETFHGPHNPPYGIETMTFTIRPGEIVLNDYVHQNK